MDEREPIALEFVCPFRHADGYRSDGFLGAWSPRPLAIEGLPADSSHAAYLRGPNWFLCSAVAAMPSGHRPKIHADRQHDRGLAFRGYLVDPPLHHFSAPADLWSYWKRGGGRCPNGVFASVLVDGRESRLTLTTDAFGFSPLYYRTQGDLVLFGTKPDFLATEDTEIDPLGAATVMAHNYPLGDRTLFRGIHRCPYGTTLRFEGSSRPVETRWFSAGDLPDPDRPFDNAAARSTEDALGTAVRRCTELNYGEVHVPLSSGHDSRRILAALLQQGTPFRATTVRVYRKGARDLDARYAAEIANHFGIPHRIVDLPEPNAYALDDAARRFELCAETSMHHGWVPTLMRALPTGPATVFDGFLGDVLATPGYRLAGAHFFANPEQDIEQIANDIARTSLRRHVAEEFHPGEQAAEELRAYLGPLAGKQNVAEFALILLHQRRATALWSQQLGRPEHLFAWPFADLDYIRTITAVRPEDRWAAHVQHACLQRFHPQLAGFAGSREIPADAPPVGQESNRRRALACARHLCAGLKPVRRWPLLAQRLTPVGQAVTTATCLAPEAVTRWHWILRPVCEVLMHDCETTAVWRIRVTGTP